MLPSSTYGHSRGRRSNVKRKYVTVYVKDRRYGRLIPQLRGARS
jgi:hypothetical protein